MAADFHTLIRQNQRNSWLLIAGFTCLIVVLGGAIGYAWAGLYADGSPELALATAASGMAVAFVVAVVGAAGSYFAGPSAILALSGARPLRRSEDPVLWNVVEEMAIAAGIPTPNVYVIDDTAPNAFATGRDPEHAVVAVTRGLREKLTRDELQGVIAHEISHIRNHDILFGVLMATLVGVVVLLCDMFLRSLRWGRFSGRSRSARRGKGGGSGALIVVLLALLLSVIAPLLAKLIEMAFSRQREYLADAAGVELTRNPDGLAGALAKIASDPEVLEAANRATAPLYFVHPIKSFEQRASTIMDSHPPVKDRIARILSLKGRGAMP